MKYKYFSVLALLFSTPFMGNSQVNLTDGLVAHYPFSGNANDKSVNNLNGTTHGGVSLTTDRFNNANSAYEFDGDDGFIDVPFNNAFNLTGDKSFSLWYYIGTGKVGGNSTFIHLKNKNSDYYPTYHLAQLEDKTYAPHQYQTSFFFGKSTTNYPVYTTQLFNKYQKQWVHIAASYSQSTGDMKIYFNGKLSDSSNVGNVTANSSNSNLNIGRITYSPTNDEGPSYFTGSMDEVRIYNRAINESEVLALYNESNSTSGVEVTTNTSFKIYPNPTSSDFNFEVNQASTLMVYDVKGSLVFERNITEIGTQNIDISNLSSGLYILKLIQGNQVMNTKLIKP